MANEECTATGHIEQEVSRTGSEAAEQDREVGSRAES